MAHLVTYVRLLDADAEGADWQEVAAIVLELDVAKDPKRAWRSWASHLARGKWMTESGAIATSCEAARRTKAAEHRSMGKMMGRKKPCPLKTNKTRDFLASAGGQGGIRTRGGCYTTHAFQACALNHSATCPFSAVGRSYSAVDRLGNGIFPRSTHLARVQAAIWGIDGGGSGLGVVAAGAGRRSNRARWIDLVVRRLLPFAGPRGPVVGSRHALARRHAERGSTPLVGRAMELDRPAGPDDSGAAGLPGARRSPALARQSQRGRWRAGLSGRLAAAAAPALSRRAFLRSAAWGPAPGGGRP